MSDDFFDFMIEGGDELLNSEECPICGKTIYLDIDISLTDKEQGFYKCPNRGGKIHKR